MKCEIRLFGLQKIINFSILLGLLKWIVHIKFNGLNSCLFFRQEKERDKQWYKQRLEKWEKQQSTTEVRKN